MNVVGWEVAYSIVPLVVLDDTTDGQVMVDFASVPDDIDEEPKNGSLRPH